jgi:sugar lactone lactonase YvrE
VFVLPRGDTSSKTALSVNWPGSPSGWALPKGLWVDPQSKDVFVADSQNLVVVAGNGTGQVRFVGGPGYFSGLSDVFVDAQGTIWAVDNAASRVYRITGGGTTISQLAPGIWTQPVAVAVSPAGVVYVSDFGNSTVAAIDAWGAGSLSVITDGLSQPTGIWWSATTNYLYVCEYNNVAIYRYANGAGTAQTVQGTTNYRPTDVGGAPWSSVWDTQEPDSNVPGQGGGLFLTGPSYGTSLPTFSSSSLQGLWLDC